MGRVGLSLDGGPPTLLWKSGSGARTTVMEGVCVTNFSGLIFPGGHSEPRFRLIAFDFPEPRRVRRASGPTSTSSLASHGPDDGRDSAEGCPAKRTWKVDDAPSRPPSAWVKGLLLTSESGAQSGHRPPSRPGTWTERPRSRSGKISMTSLPSLPDRPPSLIPVSVPVPTSPSDSPTPLRLRF